ncbi:HK97 gp10 family phage protein [Vibrio parahaemolyticus]
MISTSMEGFQDANDMLADLQSILGKKAARAAAKQAMTPVLNEIQQTAPYDALTDDGIHLREHFKLSVTGRTARDRRKDNTTFLRARVQTSSKDVERYAALVEFGRHEFTTVKTNAYGIPTSPFSVTVKPTAANPFMRPAMNKHQDNVVDTFKTGIINEANNIAQNRNRTARSKIKVKERKAKKALG